MTGNSKVKEWIWNLFSPAKLQSPNSASRISIRSASSAGQSSISNASARSPAKRIRTGSNNVPPVMGMGSQATCNQSPETPHHQMMIDSVDEHSPSEDQMALQHTEPLLQVLPDGNSEGGSDSSEGWESDTAEYGSPDSSIASFDLDRALEELEEEQQSAGDLPRQYLLAATQVFSQYWSPALRLSQSPSKAEHLSATGQGVRDGPSSPSHHGGCSRAQLTSHLQ